MFFSNLDMSPFKRSLEFISNIRLSLFLLLCFIFGGTSQDIVAPKLGLYLISLLAIGYCLTVLNRESKFWDLKSMNMILGAFFIAHIVYLIPLPPGIWSHLPGRDFIVQGYQTLEVDLPWLPLSITPEKTYFSLFDFLPPLALILMIGTVVTAREIRVAIRTIGFFVILSAILGILQILNVNESLYFYRFTNDRSAVGFFSNANHLGVFVLMAIPIVMCLHSVLRDNYEEYSNKVLVFSIVCIFSGLLGIGASGSLGGFLLIIPVLVGTSFIWTSGEGRKTLYITGITGPLIAALIFDMFIWGNLQSEALAKFTHTHSMDRQTFFENTFNIGKSFFPFGTGPGSFSDIYKLVEETSQKTVPHTHNDYIEIFSEFGALGLCWMFVAVLWLLKNFWTAFKSRGTFGKISKYFSIPIMVIMVHSLFDYSLRTISVMTLFIFCLCILVLSNRSITTMTSDEFD